MVRISAWWIWRGMPYMDINSLICILSVHVLQQIHEINSQVAQFRDLLINIGQSRDGPELRERVRKLRRNCVEACKSASQLILPQMRRYVFCIHFINNPYRNTSLKLNTKKNRVHQSLILSIGSFSGCGESIR